MKTVAKPSAKVGVHERVPSQFTLDISPMKNLLIVTLIPSHFLEKLSGELSRVEFPKSGIVWDGIIWQLLEGEICCRKLSRANCPRGSCPVMQIMLIRSQLTFCRNCREEAGRSCPGWNSLQVELFAFRN